MAEAGKLRATFPRLLCSQGPDEVSVQPIRSTCVRPLLGKDDETRSLVLLVQNVAEVAWLLETVVVAAPSRLYQRQRLLWWPHFTMSLGEAFLEALPGVFLQAVPLTNPSLPELVQMDSVVCN